MSAPSTRSILSIPSIHQSGADYGVGRGEIAIYRAPDGTISLDVRLEHETLWLSLNQMADLFDRDKSVITKHLRNVFQTGELARDSVSAFFAQTAADGKTYQVEFYNLDAILSVGYRVNSRRGTQFRIWATAVLCDYILQGFAVNDKRCKTLGKVVRRRLHPLWRRLHPFCRTDFGAGRRRKDEQGQSDER